MVFCTFCEKLFWHGEGKVADPPRTYVSYLHTRLSVTVGCKQCSPQRVKASGSATPYQKLITVRYAINSERYTLQIACKNTYYAIQLFFAFMTSW